MTHRGRVADEAGAVAVIAALTLTVLLMFAAFVIDLGALRADRSVGQGVADLAATAGAQVYDAEVAGSAQEACLQAIAYAAENLGGTSAPDGTDCATAFPSGQLCSSAWGSANYVVTTPAPQSREYQISVTIPVPDMSGLMLNENYGATDGNACERIGVSITHERDLLLASAGGGPGESQTTMSAVGRSAAAGDKGEYASLIVLHPNECNTLMAGGQSENEIVVNGNGTRGDPDYLPGVITVDSHNDTCTNPSQIIRTDGGNSEIFAADHIYSYQLQAKEGSTNIAYSGTVFTDRAPNVPEPGRRITRSPVDNRYNCLANYPTKAQNADAFWSPRHDDFAVAPGLAEGCPEAGEGPAYVQNLHAAYQPKTAAAAQIDGWSVLSGKDDCSGLTAHLGSADDADDRGGNGTHWFIDCEGKGGQKGFTPTDVHFDGVETIVTRGQITLGGNESLRIVAADSDVGATVYLQDGSFTTGSATIDLESTFVYVHEGVVAFSAGVEVNWSAPYGPPPNDDTSWRDDRCAGYDASPSGAPPAACLSPLALWSNDSGVHFMAGNGGVTVAGSFFTPNAKFRLAGGNANDYTDAQFFTAMLEASGGGSVTMVPNPNTNIEIPLTGSSLIR